MRRALVLAVLTLLALGPAIAFAQAYGRLFGTVVDSDGAPLAGVQVSLEIQGSDARLETTTDKKGKFKLAVVDATKRLTLRLVMEGFQTRAEDVKIPIGQVIQGTWGMEREGTGASIALPSKVDGVRAAVLVFNEGVKAFNEGDKATALLKFEEARSIDPSIKELYEVLATLYLETNRMDDAAAAAATLIGLDANNRVALETEFAVAESRGDLPNAYRTADLLAQLYPGESAALIAYNAAVLANKAKDLANAERLFAASVAMNPTLLPPRIGLARTLLALGKADAAVAAADEIIALDPNNGLAWNIRYEVYKAKGDKAKAEEAYAKVFSVNPAQAAQVMLEEGQKAFESGDAARAIEVLNRLLELSPDHPRAHYFLGMASVSTGKMDEAKRLLARFVELAPNDPEAGTAREMLKSF